jgi:hypothetical protein
MTITTTNLDKIWQATDGEVFNATAFNFFTANPDNFFSKLEIVLEPFDSLHSETQYIRDTFHSLTTQEAVSVLATVQPNNFDSFSAIGDQTVESIEKMTVSWGFPSTLITEVTDAARLLPVVLNPYVVASNITVDYAVQNTSTAQNVTEYEVAEGITGTLDFGSSDFNGHVRYLNIAALTQVFSKPQRTVVLKLSNVQGSGTFWPSVTFKQPAVAGRYMYLFNNYFYAGTHYPVGSSAEDQAQKLATAWNIANLTCSQNTGTGYKAIATAVGTTVSFALTPIGLDTDGNFSFYNGDVANVLMYSNGGYPTYYYLAAPNRRDNWELTLDSEDTLIVTIDAHGPRPGTVSVFSYDVTTKRATKRGQVPTTAVSGLKEKLTSIEARLKNRGF